MARLICDLDGPRIHAAATVPAAADMRFAALPDLVAAIPAAPR